MTAPPQTNSQGLDTSKVPITEEHFLKLIEQEMFKVEAFTLQKVTQLREIINTMEALLKQTNSAGQAAWDAVAVDAKANTIADEFLRLEKYVNLNFMGFHKILKKHDKNLPNNPCKAFYVNRLHAQAWVRGDYSDIVVRLSNIYSALRDDHVAEENKDASQSFLRSTTKYWVKTEDVSRVKYAILRHLPVFLQKTSTGESDSQFTNSVYLDNDQVELYHGRLDKTPGAIALRLRWYGPGDPQLIFVERKTHNEKWTGEVSVKERFIVRFCFCACCVYCVCVLCVPVALVVSVGCCQTVRTRIGLTRSSMLPRCLSLFNLTPRLRSTKKKSSRS
jgi:SPX domain protein involved in polyphosphate accumulation